jgi:hypothetical protein
VRSNPLRAIFVLVRLASKGRRSHNAFGNRACSKASTQSARAAKEPWLLVACTAFSGIAAKRLVRLYRQRMQIEIDQSCCLHKSVFHGLASVMGECFDQVRGAVRNALSRSNSAAFA